MAAAGGAEVCRDRGCSVAAGDESAVCTADGKGDGRSGELAFGLWGGDRNQRRLAAVYITVGSCPKAFDSVAEFHPESFRQPWFERPFSTVCA